MLKLILGPAGAGKTARMMEEMKQRIDARQDRNILIVPEQYSYEAERELLEHCGDSTSLYAEVLTFSRLAFAVEQELGGGARVSLDTAGRLLRLRVVMEKRKDELRIYGNMLRRPENLLSLLSALNDLHYARVDSERLREVSQNVGGVLGDKLSDLALLADEMDSAAEDGTADPLTRLDRLAESAPRSALLKDAHIWVDGFVDFTAQERVVLRQLWNCGSVTVCLSCNDLHSRTRAEFESSRMAALHLKEEAEQDGLTVETEVISAPSAETPLTFLQENLLQYTARTVDASGNVALRTAPSMEAECELAAAEVLRLVHESGCRWRDIAIAVRGFGDYRRTLENVFERYGIPLYTTRSADIRLKSAAALLLGALSLPESGWAAGDVLACARTGLLGLGAAECDELENYALVWNVRGPGWYGPDPWRQHPDGYDGRPGPEAEQRLRLLNRLRTRVAEPLRALQLAGDRASTALQQCEALSDFCDRIHLPRNLDSRAQELRQRGFAQAADEMLQVWDKIVEALEQCAAVLGDMPMSRREFTILFGVMLSQYQVITIPVSVDRVTAGDFDRMRRRHLRHLLVLGATNDRLPSAGSENPVFTVSELDRLRENELPLENEEESIQREYALIYNVFSLPSDTLYVSRPLRGSDGNDTYPSFISSQIARLGLVEERAGSVTVARANCSAGVLELAAAGCGEAEGCLDEKQAERLAQVRSAAEQRRDSLSKAAARSLYGVTPYLSPSGLDVYGSCPYQYFLKVGLKARPREAAEFDARIFGSYVHDLLEKVAIVARERSTPEQDGFDSLTEEDVTALCRQVTETYIHETLNDFKEKTARFTYVFLRAQEEARSIVMDTVRELQCSRFRPLALEQELKLPGGAGEGEPPALTGRADRIDLWEHDGIAYLRVVDYKSGTKKFNYADIRDGMNLQMLLYLFALSADTLPALRGKVLQPAGVLYVPAKEPLVSDNVRPSTEEVAKARQDEKKRSGLLLNDETVLTAMENSGGSGKERFRYLPVSVDKEGNIKDDKLADAARLELLSDYVDGLLVRIADELRSGNIRAFPRRAGSSKNACDWCDYRDVCRFDDTREECRNSASMKAGAFWEMLGAEGTGEESEEKEAENLG